MFLPQYALSRMFLTPAHPPPSGSPFPPFRNLRRFWLSLDGLRKTQTQLPCQPGRRAIWPLVKRARQNVYSRNTVLGRVDSLFLIACCEMLQLHQAGKNYSIFCLIVSFEPAGSAFPLNPVGRPKPLSGQTNRCRRYFSPSNSGSRGAELRDSTTPLGHLRCEVLSHRQGILLEAQAAAAERRPRMGEALVS